MTTYTSVFGSETIPPSKNGYAAVALTADTTFYWPELASGSNLMADIMEVTPDAAWTMTFPAANGVSTGRDVLVRNLGAFTITIHDSAGGTIGTVAAGVAKYIYITDNSTAAGAWTVFTFGTGTSAADAATLAGYGLLATGSTLSQQALTVSSAVTTTVLTSQRAETLIFTNSGVVTCNMPLASSAGNGFFINISNQGTGTVTIDPSGAETIDGEATKDLAPGESLTAVCSGTTWASIGYGRSTQFQFTKLVLDISAGTPFTLTSVQAQNKLIQTIGVIGAGVTINVPAVVAVYYIECSHTGAFTTTFKTAAGTGVGLASGERSILYCDGVNVVEAQTASVPAATLSGGVAGSLVYQSGVGVTGFSAVGATGQVAISGGTGSPTWSDLGLITTGCSSKATPVDADELPLSDSAAAQGPKKVTWANLKATLGATFAALAGSVSQVFSASSIELGHASDTTLTRVSAGVVAVEGSNVLLASGLGSVTQAYDTDTTKNDVANTFTAQQSFTGPTAAAPAIAGASDPNTGVFFPAADTVAVATAGIERMRIDASGNLLVTSTAGLGYGTGAGGTVTQATSKATAITLNKPCGWITTAADALAANTTARFTFTNSLLSVNDCIVLTIRDGVTAGAYQVWVDGTANGSCTVALHNITAGSLSNAVVINFTILKGATS